MQLRAPSGFIRRLRDPKVRAAYLFVLPPIVIVTIFAVLPSIASISLSFFSYDIVNLPKFIGLRNWSRLFTDEIFIASLINTAYFMAGHVPLIVVAGLTAALILNEKWFPGKTAMRAMYFLPVVVSMVAVAFVWNWLLNPSFGIANAVLEWFGIPRQKWLGDPVLAMPTVIIVSVWKNLGFYLVVFLAGLQGISPTYYEAARIDGANKWQEVWHITLPLLKHTMAFATIIGVIGSFQVFEQIYVMTQGGPMDRTRVVVYHLWWTGFQRLRMGYASAMAVVVFVIVMSITLIQLKFYSRRSAEF